MNEHLVARYEMITDMATLAREMLSDVDCNDWKWESYRERLKSVANDISEKEEKNKKLKSVLKNVGNIFKVFLFLVYICGLVVVCVYMICGLSELIEGRIAFNQLVVRILGTCASLSPIVYYIKTM